MNDLDLMEKFRADVAPPEPVALARARAGMFRTKSPKRRSVWVWRLAPASALVAAVAVTAVAVRPSSESPMAVLPVTESSAAAPPPASEAARVLQLAAAEARREPVLAARPDQFVYIRSRTAYANTEIDEERKGRDRYIPPVERERRIWVSVDGSRTGLLRERGTEPGSELSEVPLDGTGPVYRTDLPTDAKAMRAYLYADPNPPKPDGPSLDTQAWTKIGDTLREQYVTPDSLAALFDAASTLPGATVVKQTDLAGRRGIAVSWSSGAGRHDLIFDAKTYRFLGARDVVVGDLPPYPKGAVTGWTAQLEVAIVDQAGQLP